jgi:uncharacterized membrane protein YqiK
MRSVIANMGISDVIKKRETVRKEVKTKLQKQLKGMGIYLETFEIKSLEIVNYQLFKDM